MNQYLILLRDSGHELSLRWSSEEILLGIEGWANWQGLLSLVRQVRGKEGSNREIFEERLNDI